VSIAVACALASALLYALASVWQQRAAGEQSPDFSLRLGLLARLARSRLWLAGIAADVGAYIAQFVALGHGSLVLVQPLLVCGLLFALPLGAHLAHSRLSAQDWAGALAVCAGLAMFLACVGSPHDHRHPSLEVWTLLLGSAAAVTLALALAASGRSAHRRAALLSAGAGVVYGVAAGFTRTTAHLLSHRGLVHVLSSWTTYGLVVAGVVGMVLAQSAFQAGHLDSSLPPMTVVDPIVSILIGVAAFGDRLPSSPGTLTLEIFGLLLMTIGVFVLARGKAIHALHA